MKKLSYPAVGDELYTTVLENGLTVCVVPRRGFRRRQATFAVNYGGAARSFTLAGKRIDTPAGCAHFLEHKMFDMPDGSAMDIFTQRGAEANAYTSADLTAYYFECDQDFHANLELLLKFVTTPYFTAESVERERGIERVVYAGEIMFKPEVAARKRGAEKFKPFSQFPAASRDVAVIVKADESAAAVASEIKKIASQKLKNAGFELESAELFDTYSGKGVDEGFKSLAFALSFRSPEKTLQTDEVNKVFEAVCAELGKKRKLRI